jgi:flavin-dependent dehydrogenase
VGIGSVGDGRDLRARHREFVDRLRRSGRIPAGLELVPFRGHAYALRVTGPRKITGPGFFLAGDAAGLARGISGEGIGPAVASARLAADGAIAALAGAEDAADTYARAVTERFGAGDGGGGWAGRLLAALPSSWTVKLGELVCRQAWLRRRLVFEGAFGMG